MKVNNWYKLISAAMLYVVVFVGLYIFKNAWAAILLYHLGIALLMVIGNRKDLLKSVFAGWNLTFALIAVAVCALSGPAILLFWEYMRLDQIALGTVLGDFGLDGWSWYLFIIYFVTVQPVLEELYWRRFPGSSRKWLCFTDLAFAGYHIFVLVWFIKWPWLVAAFIVLSTAGFFWRRIAGKFGGLTVPILSHIAADVSIVAAVSVLAQ